MKIVLSSLCLLLASGVCAADEMPALGPISFVQLRAAKLGVGSLRAAGDVISSYHMLAQAGKDAVFGYADNEADAAEAIAYWTAVLKSAGVRVEGSTFSDGMYRILYKTADGRVIRDFLADSRQFSSKDEAELRSNMALASGALNKAGLDVVASRVIKVDEILPTYAVLYLTRPDQLPERETRLRVLKAGDDVEFDVFRGAGIDVIQTPKTWMMVYIGPEVGIAALTAKTREDLDAQIAKRREGLTGAGKRIIAERRMTTGDSDYRFAAALYYYQ